MTQLLNSLVIAQGQETVLALEKVMAINIEGYILSFLSVPLDEIDALDRRPDLIFIDLNADLTADDVNQVTKKYPKTTCVVLGDVNEMLRRQYMRAGADEVMSMAELESPIGKHMLEKLLAFKDLADAEKMIAQSEERFKGVIEHSHDIILLLDPEGTIVYTSPAFGRQVGYEEWEVLGQSVTDFLHDSDIEVVRANFDALLHATPSEAFSLEFRFRTKTGAWRNFEAIATNLLGNETVQSVVVNMRDMTDQKQAEAELEEYRLHLEALVEKRTREVAEVQSRANTVVAASPDALIALDDDGVITFISQHYAETYPKSADRLQAGKRFIEAFPSIAQEIGLADHDPRFMDMMNWWSSPRGTKEFRLNNGTWLRLQAKRMAGDGGTVVSTTNITDYIRQQNLLAEQSAVLEEALQKERGIVEQQKTFVSMVSHEFRTPLTIIDGNAQIIQSRGDMMDKEMLVKRSTTIRGAVERLVRLIESILSAHMLESGRLTVDLDECDIDAVLRSAIADQQDLTPSHKIRFDLRGLPRRMLADEKVIRQMMVNLLSNAVKYSPGKDQIEVIAFTVGNKLVIEVEDHGVGIPEKELPKIATKYFRASTSGGIPGTGLGLSLVRQFVDLHHGTFDIRSEVGKGTVVSVSLPIRDDAEIAAYKKLQPGSLG